MVKENNQGCIVVIIGFILGTIIFNSIYIDEVWDRVLNAPVEHMATSNSIGIWLLLCIACSWLVGKVWKLLDNEN